MTNKKATVVFGQVIGTKDLRMLAVFQKREDAVKWASEWETRNNGMTVVETAIMGEEVHSVIVARGTSPL